MVALVSVSPQQCFEIRAALYITSGRSPSSLSNYHSTATPKPRMPEKMSFKMSSKICPHIEVATEPPFLDERWYRTEKGLDPDRFKKPPVELVFS